MLNRLHSEERRPKAKASKQVPLAAESAIELRLGDRHSPAMLPTLRFAPSPNGFLHLGHAFSVLENQRLANALGGRLLLRIEDIDRARCRPEFEAAMLEDLAWLGITFAEAPGRQSDHLANHSAALARLDAMGLVYRSVETRAEVRALLAAYEAGGTPWPRDPDGAPRHPLPGARREAREPEEPFAWRLDMAKALARLGEPLFWTESDETGRPGRRVVADPAAWGDVVLARKETPTSYHLAVLVDDAAQGVTHVVRGDDLFHATSVHRLLQELLGLPEPLYRHHRLVLGLDGKKLSKSKKATGLRALREAGATAEDVRRMAGI